jgi:hypothetical protein
MKEPNLYANAFLNVSYIRFKYIYFFKFCLRPKYPVFQILGKKRYGERNSKGKLWKNRDVEEK